MSTNRHASAGQTPISAVAVPGRCSCNRRRQRILLTLLVAFQLLTAFTTVAADDPAAPPLVWNRFLTDWHILGPFPKETATSSGLDTDFMDEANLRIGRVGFYQDKLYRWVPWGLGAIDFREALQAHNEAGDRVVAYAMTHIFSPVEQPAVLAIAHDDGVVAWVNGVEVARKNVDTAAILDYTTGETTLQKGVNTVVLKVANGETAWQAAARFRPAGLDEPLFSFLIKPSGDFKRMPVATVELLDANSNVISTHQCNGLRKSWPGINGYYSVYAPEPTRPPKFGRITIDTSDMLIRESLFPWDRLQAGNVTVDVLPTQPLVVTVVDATTRKPLAGASIWESQEVVGVTDELGTATLPTLNVMANYYWVAADGYMAAQQSLPWPRPKGLQVQLKPGGHTLSGRITSAAGAPIASATVESGLTTAYSPTVTTDVDGRFAFLSLPGNVTRLNAVVSARGYMKQQFRQAVDGTAVAWSLEPGAVIVGRITHSETKEPIAGVAVTTGVDRFGGSNDEAPTSITDADGRYELSGVQPGSNIVHALSEDHAPQMKSVVAKVGAEVENNFELSDGKPVTGVIVDKDGQPVPQVWLVTDTWNGARMFKREARTDAQGRFTLEHMPETEVETDVLKQGYISQRNVSMTGGDTVDLTMKPTVTHSITIRDADGRVVPDLSITKGYLWNGNSTYSWSSSQWETDRYYDKLAGVMNVVIDEMLAYDIAYRFRANGFSESIVKLPTAADTGQMFEVILQQVQSFTGQVIDAETGEPLSDIVVASVNENDRFRSNYVQFYSPWNYLQQRRYTGPTATTDSDGIFRLASPADDKNSGLVLISETHGFHYVPGINGATVAAATQNDQPFSLPLPGPGVIEGQVLVAGEPVPGAIIHLDWSQNAGDRNNSSRFFSVSGQITADADGHFSIGNLGPGHYRLSRVFAYDRPGGGGSSMYLGGDDVILLPGQKLLHDLSRPAGLRFSGIAQDPAGNPLPNTVVTVQLQGTRERFDAMLTDENGRFRFDHLPAGSWTVTGQHDVATGRYAQTTDFSGNLMVELSDSVTDAVLEITPPETRAVGNTTQVVRETLTGTLPQEFAAIPIGAAAPFRLSEHFGKVVIVWIWSQWSEDIDSMTAVYQQHKDDPDVEFCSFYVGSNEAEARRVLAEHESDMPTALVLYDDETSVPRLFGTDMSGLLVIGRDGRFFGDEATSENLDSTIKAALTSDVAKPELSADQVRILLTRDENGDGIPQAKLKLEVRSAADEVLHEDRYERQGVVRDVLWRIPAVRSAAKLVVTLTAPGVDEQQQTILRDRSGKRPAVQRQLLFNAASPRTIIGQVIAKTSTSESRPVAGLPLILNQPAGEVLSTVTDADGRFSVPCFFGSYLVSLPRDSQYALPEITPRYVTVTNAANPEPVAIVVSAATTIRGQVVDAAGESVAGAVVASLSRDVVRCDKDGRFELSGVASFGKVRIWASHNKVYGAILLTDPDPAADHIITLGRGLESIEADHSDATAMFDIPAPPLPVFTLEGNSTVWSPASANRDHLLVFCELWHPESLSAVRRAVAWAQQHNALVDIISLDWNLAQVQRERPRYSDILPTGSRTFYAGPRQLKLPSEWTLPSIPRQVIITADGTRRMPTSDVQH